RTSSSWSPGTTSAPGSSSASAGCLRPPSGARVIRMAGEWDDDDYEDRERIEEVASRLDDKYGSADSQRLPRDKRFRTEVARLAEPQVDVDIVVRLARDDNAYIACMALAALAQRKDVPADWTRWAMSALRRVDNEVEPFVYAALVIHASYPVIGPALT